jgi:hypothetical protein
MAKIPAARMTTPATDLVVRRFANDLVVEVVGAAAAVDWGLAVAVTGGLTNTMGAQAVPLDVVLAHSWLMPAQIRVVSTILWSPYAGDDYSLSMVPWAESGPVAGADTLLATAQVMQALTPAPTAGVHTQSVGLVVALAMAGSFVQACFTHIVSFVEGYK